MTDEIIASLPLPLRLSLSYAGVRSRSLFLGLFALDTRLAGILRQGREPLLAQMRLAWWRETLEKTPGNRPTGEPLLGLLSNWRGEEQALAGLVEGWETLLAEPPMPAGQILHFGQARGNAFAAVARLCDAAAHAEDAARAGLLWAMADFASGVTEPSEKEAALSIARNAAAQPARLPKTLRPLAVLAGLARRSVGMGGEPMLGGAAAGLLAMRIGILGR